MIPALIAAGAAIGSTIYNNIANRKLANEQNKYNYNLWKEQNQYNLPSEQIRRLKEAGINPNLYASQVVGTNRADGGAPSANLANQTPILDGSTAASLADTIMDNQVDKQNADSNETTANAAAQNAETEAARQMVDAMMAQSNIEVNNEKKKVYVEQVKQIDKQNKNLSKQYEILDEEQKQSVIKTARDKIEKDLYEKYGEKQIEADLKLKSAQEKVAISQSLLNTVTAKLAPAYLAAAQEQASAATTSAEANWMNAQTNIQEAQKRIEEINGKIDLMVKQGELNDAQATFFKSFTAEKILGMVVSVGSFFIPGGGALKTVKAVRKGAKLAKAAGKAIPAARKVTKGAKLAAKASKAQKAAGKAMAHPTGSFTPAGSRQLRTTTVNPHM